MDLWLAKGPLPPPAAGRPGADVRFERHVGDRLADIELDSQALSSFVQGRSAGHGALERVEGLLLRLSADGQRIEEQRRLPARRTN